MVEVPIELDRPLPAADSWSVDRQADLDDVYQEEPAGGLRVPVEVEGPVRVQQAGSVDETYRSVSVDDVIGGKLFNSDPRRSYCTIIAIDQPIWLANTQSEVQGTTGAKIPLGVPISIKATARVFARSATAGQNALVSIISGQWAR